MEEPKIAKADPAKGGPSCSKPKTVEVINLSSDDEADRRNKEAAISQLVLVANLNPGDLEEEEEDPDYEEEEEEGDDSEESVDSEVILSSWSLPAPSTTRGDDEYDDPHFWHYGRDLDNRGTDFGGGNHNVEPAPAEMCEGNCPGPSSSAA
ncbi:hypothetical protein PIB30_091428 [Stylosanthes scabra]|uniref:Uncharacterized protein n=1 Tax=Stylosanthes scabra TaxID=79078 RepID=A0ABU6XTX3_9FABA|nr:hypothetical protein [Stylosanthes scabra]